MSTAGGIFGQRSLSAGESSEHQEVIAFCGSRLAIAVGAHAQVLLQSLGDFAASVTASVGAGTRSASLGLHLFDFGLSLAPSDVTGYRAGYPLGLLVTSTVTPGSTAQRPSHFHSSV